MHSFHCIYLISFTPSFKGKHGVSSSNAVVGPSCVVAKVERGVGDDVAFDESETVVMTPTPLKTSQMTPTPIMILPSKVEQDVQTDLSAFEDSATTIVKSSQAHEGAVAMEEDDVVQERSACSSDEKAYVHDDAGDTRSSVSCAAAVSAPAAQVEPMCISSNEVELDKDQTPVTYETDAVPETMTTSHV